MNDLSTNGKTKFLQALKYVLQSRQTKCPMTLSLGRTSESLLKENWTLKSSLSYLKHFLTLKIIFAIIKWNHFKMYMFGVLGETHAHDYFPLRQRETDQHSKRANARNVRLYYPYSTLPTQHTTFISLIHSGRTNYYLNFTSVGQNVRWFSPCVGQFRELVGQCLWPTDILRLAFFVQKCANFLTCIPLSFLNHC